MDGKKEIVSIISKSINSSCYLNLVFLRFPKLFFIFKFKLTKFGVILVV